VTPATIPKDFARNPRIHQCFEIRVPEGAAKAPRPVLTLSPQPKRSAARGAPRRR
jgi:hypothetical protein